MPDTVTWAQRSSITQLKLDCHVSALPLVSSMPFSGRLTTLRQRTVSFLRVCEKVTWLHIILVDGTEHHAQLLGNEVQVDLNRFS